MRKTKSKNVSSISKYTKNISPWDSSRAVVHFKVDKDKLTFKQRLMKLFLLTEVYESDKKRKDWKNKKEMRIFKKELRDKRIREQLRSKSIKE